MTNSAKLHHIRVEIAVNLEWNVLCLSSKNPLISGRGILFFTDFLMCKTVTAGECC